MPTPGVSPPPFRINTGLQAGSVQVGGIGESISPMPDITSPSVACIHGSGASIFRTELSSQRTIPYITPSPIILVFPIEVALMSDLKGALVSGDVALAKDGFSILNLTSETTPFVPFAIAAISLSSPIIIFRGSGRRFKVQLGVETVNAAVSEQVGLPLTYTVPVIVAVPGEIAVILVLKGKEKSGETAFAIELLLEEKVTYETDPFLTLIEAFKGALWPIFLVSELGLSEMLQLGGGGGVGGGVGRGVGTGGAGVDGAGVEPGRGVGVLGGVVGADVDTGVGVTDESVIVTNALERQRSTPFTKPLAYILVCPADIGLKYI